MSKSVAYVAFVVASAFFALPAFAEQTVKVMEDGEGGGAMSLKIDKASVPAGETVFTVHNSAMTEEHEMVLVKLNSADQVVPVIKSKHRIDEKKLKGIGEVSDLKPGADGQLKAKLAPGSYLLLCNIKGHYEAGMQTRLTVTP